MCGIVAVIGQQACRDSIVQGLRALEYRGYDSVGCAYVETGTDQIRVVKVVGDVTLFKAKLSSVKSDGTIGIGHTRWATQGRPTLENAHPHLNCDGTVAVVHNGTLERASQLREKLLADGHHIVSQTDSELIAHMMAKLLDLHAYDMHAALAEAQTKLSGEYAFVVVSSRMPHVIGFVRNHSPLFIGVGEKQMFLVSDQIALSSEVKQVVFVPDVSCGVVTAHGYEVWGQQNRQLALMPVPKSIGEVALDKGNFDHYMLKEMYEQKESILQTVRALQAIDTLPSVYTSAVDILWERLCLSAPFVHNLSRIYLIGVGSSHHAARIAQLFFESITHLTTRVISASEFDHASFHAQPDALYVFISQSGETADTVQALRHVRKQGGRTLAIVNVRLSPLGQEAEGVLCTQAGPEIAQAATKTFVSQLALLYWLAHRMAYTRGLIPADRMREAIADCICAADALENGIIAYEYELRSVVGPRYASFDRMIFVGQQGMYPFAREAALKMKQTAHVFAHACTVGEMNHDSMALVDARTPVVLFSSLDEQVYQKVVRLAHEIKARDGHVVVFAFTGQHELIKLAETVFIIPSVAPLLAPLAAAGIMQLFAYSITHYLGLPVDQPRSALRVLR